MIHKKEKEKGKWVCSPIPEFAKKQFGSWIQNIFIHLCWIIIATLLIYYYYYCVLYFRTLQCVCVCVYVMEMHYSLNKKRQVNNFFFFFFLLPSTFQFHSKLLTQLFYPLILPIVWISLTDLHIQKCLQLVLLQVVVLLALMVLVILVIY